MLNTNTSTGLSLYYSFFASNLFTFDADNKFLLLGNGTGFKKKTPALQLMFFKPCNTD